MSKYSKAPLIEAICELQFPPQIEWGSVWPGLLYEKLKAQFPEIKSRKLVTFNLPAKPVEVSPTVAERTQFWRTDGKMVIQIGTHLLSINHLAPYPGWESYFPVIRDTVETFREITGVQLVKRFGLRYINRFTFETDAVNLKRFFSFYPQTPQAIPSIKNFSAMIDVEGQTESDNLRLQIASVPHQPDKPNDPSTVLFDLDFSRTGGELPIADYEAVLSSGHTLLDQAFEGCMTEEMKGRLR